MMVMQTQTSPIRQISECLVHVIAGELPARLIHYRSRDYLDVHEFQQRQRWEDDQSYKHISLRQVPIPGHERAILGWTYGAS